MNTYSIEVKESGTTKKIVTRQAPDALTAINSLCGIKPASNMEFVARLISREVWYLWEIPPLPNLPALLRAVSPIEARIIGEFLVLGPGSSRLGFRVDSAQVSADVRDEDLPNYIRQHFLKTITPQEVL